MSNTAPRILRDWELHLTEPDATAGTYSYPYSLRLGGWEELQTIVRYRAINRFMIVTDSGFPEFLTEMVQTHLSAIGPCTLHTFPGTEQAKTIETVGQLALEAVQAHIGINSAIVALGGGLTGNVTGLLAALAFRGQCFFLQIPTTLLAMSDSCLSLKQGVNLGGVKNFLGTYHAPGLVWSDLTFLDSLPAREIRSAYDELIKNLAFISPEHYDEIEAMLNPEASYTYDQYARMIELCIEAKLLVMQQDAREKHYARVLEGGHTTGHPIEYLSHGTIPHGLAIGIGLVIEARIARCLGVLEEHDTEARLVNLLHRNGAPTAIPPWLTADELVALISKDNKRGLLKEPEGTVPMVLLKRFGEPNRTGNSVLTAVSLEVVRDAIDWSRAQNDPFALETPVMSVAAGH